MAVISGFTVLLNNVDIAATQQYIRPEIVSISNNSLRQNLNLCQYLKPENFLKQNADLEVDNPTQKRSHDNTVHKGRHFIWDTKVAHLKIFHILMLY